MNIREFQKMSEVMRAELIILFWEKLTSASIWRTAVPRDVFVYQRHIIEKDRLIVRFVACVWNPLALRRRQYGFPLPSPELYF